MWMDPVSIRLVEAQLLKASGFICINLHKAFILKEVIVTEVSYLTSICCDYTRSFLLSCLIFMFRVRS